MDLLEQVKKYTKNTIGVEPSDNVAEIAREKDIEVYTEFFGSNFQVFQVLKIKLIPFTQLIVFVIFRILMMYFSLLKNFSLKMVILYTKTLISAQCYLLDHLIRFTMSILIYFQ